MTKGVETICQRWKYIIFINVKWFDWWFVFRYATHLESGLLEVISPASAFYPNLDAVKETFGDTKDRVK